MLSNYLKDIINGIHYVKGPTWLDVTNKLMTSVIPHLFLHNIFNF